MSPPKSGFSQSQKLLCSESRTSWQEHERSVSLHQLRLTFSEKILQKLLPVALVDRIKNKPVLYIARIITKNSLITSPLFTIFLNHMFNNVSPSLSHSLDSFTAFIKCYQNKFWNSKNQRKVSSSRHFSWERSFSYKNMFQLKKMMRNRNHTQGFQIDEKTHFAWSSTALLLSLMRSLYCSNWVLVCRRREG
jgi:hypothetical protein